MNAGMFECGISGDDFVGIIVSVTTMAYLLRTDQTQKALAR
jgi:hypothetical protein